MYVYKPPSHGKSLIDAAHGFVLALIRDFDGTSEIPRFVSYIKVVCSIMLFECTNDCVALVLTKTFNQCRYFGSKT